MVHEVQFQMSWLLQVVRESEHWNIPTPGVMVLGWVWDVARFITMDAFQGTSERCHADPCQFLLLLMVKVEGSQASQVLGGGEEDRLKPFGTRVIQGLGRHSDDQTDFRAIRWASLPGSWMSHYLGSQEAD